MGKKTNIQELNFVRELLFTEPTTMAFVAPMTPFMKTIAPHAATHHREAATVAVAVAVAVAEDQLDQFVQMDTRTIKVIATIIAELVVFRVLALHTLAAFLRGLFLHKARQIVPIRMHKQVNYKGKHVRNTFTIKHF